MVQFSLELVLQWRCKKTCRLVAMQLLTCPLCNLSRNFLSLATIAQSGAQFYFLQQLHGFFLIDCKLQLVIAMCNIYSANCNEFLFPALRYKLKQKLHHVTPAHSVQLLKAPKSCEISCKEGMLHVAIYLQLVSQRHCETSCRKNCIV